MRAVLQRVSAASVTVEDQVVGEIGLGFLVLLGVVEGDTDADLDYIVDKTIALRVFPDAEGRMNVDIGQVSGALLVGGNSATCDRLTCDFQDRVAERIQHVLAATASDGSYAFIYTPASRTLTVDLTRISGGQAKAWWYNPRTGQPTEIGTFPTSAKQDFTPPDPGEMIDWVLVLDDATKNYPPPGATK